MRDFSLSEFNSKDHQAIDDRALNEAKLIITNLSEQNRRGGPRSLEEIQQSCFRGHAAEYFLIKECGFEDNPEPYQDLIDPDGNRAEIKVTKYPPKFILSDCAKYRKIPYRKFPDVVYIFRDSDYNNTYNYIGKYTWNGSEYEIR